MSYESMSNLTCANKPTYEAFIEKLATQFHHSNCSLLSNIFDGYHIVYQVNECWVNNNAALIGTQSTVIYIFSKFSKGGHFSYKRRAWQNFKE